MKATCPFCNLPLTGPQGLGPSSARPPREGDVTICADCGGIGIYGPGAETAHRPSRVEMFEHRIAFAVAEHIRSRLPIGRRPGFGS